MPNLTRCSCGTTYRLDEALTDRRIRCVGCGDMLRVGEDFQETLDRPSRRTRSRPDERDDERDDDEDDRPIRRRRIKKRKRRAGIPFLGGWLATLIGVGAVGAIALVCLAVALANPAAAILPHVIGLALMVVGGLWFLGVAFQDSPTTGLLCLCVPFYSLIVLVNSFDECKLPFFLQLVGMGFVMIAACAGGPQPGMRGY